LAQHNDVAITDAMWLTTKNKRMLMHKMSVPLLHLMKLPIHH